MKYSEKDARTNPLLLYHRKFYKKTRKLLLNQCFYNVVFFFSEHYLSFTVTYVCYIFFNHDSMYDIIVGHFQKNILFIYVIDIKWFEIANFKKRSSFFVLTLTLSFFEVKALTLMTNMHTYTYLYTSIHFRRHSTF